MKKFTTSFDARNKIKGNVSDARQTLKNRQQPQMQKSGMQDARFKIRAKKFQPIKQELLKINQSSSHAGNKSALPGRTIHNKNTASKNSAVNAKPVKKFSAPKVSGFISVNKGERTLVDKVTVHETGLKIAVRNELASSKPESSKSTKKDQALKISVDNSNSLKHSERQESPVFHHSKPILTRPNRERESSDWQRKRDYERFFLPGRQLHTPSMLSRNSHEVFTNVPHYSSAFVKHNFSDTQRPLMPDLFHHYQPSLPNNPQRKEIELFDSPSFSPLEGTKILVSNLHPVVVEEDILDLFSVVGPVRRARLFGHGKAEVVFVRKEDAILAYQKYNNRDLDGQPMIMKLLLRDEPTKNQVVYSWMNDIGSQKSRNIIEIEPDLLQRSLFKSSNTRMSSKPVVFTVKI